MVFSPHVSMPLVRRVPRSARPAPTPGCRLYASGRAGLRVHLLGVVVAVLGAWLILAVPVALVVGRFLRVGSERAPSTAAQAMSRDSLGGTAA